MSTSNSTISQCSVLLLEIIAPDAGNASPSDGDTDAAHVLDALRQLQSGHQQAMTSISILVNWRQSAALQRGWPECGDVTVTLPCH